MAQARDAEDERGQTSEGRVARLPRAGWRDGLGPRSESWVCTLAGSQALSSCPFNTQARQCIWHLFKGLPARV